jgi:hypothetical protein
MIPNTAEVFEKARAALAKGDVPQAFLALRPALEYPIANMLLDAEGWAVALSLFAEIAGHLVGEELAAKARAAKDPSDVSAQYELGYDLIDKGLPVVAATFLERANKLAPNQAGIVAELATALERGDRNEDACDVLRESPELLAAHFMLRYLLAFNAVCSGDLDEARRTLPTLAPGSTEQERYMVRTVRGMLARADVALAAPRARRLDKEDLRGWHFVITGGLLLHVSPHGFEHMHGRYAFVHDNPALCLEGIRKWIALATALAVAPPKILAAPGRDSAILARALASACDVPLAPWSENERGLVVAYDLSGLAPDVAQALAQHRPGQSLWAHASSWTEPFPFAPDVTTFLYQMNTAPWGGGMGIDPETRQVKNHPPDDAPEDVIAARVVAAELEASALDDTSDLVALATGARALPEELAPGLLRANGVRRKQFMHSPVKSNRFN